MILTFQWDNTTNILDEWSSNNDHNNEYGDYCDRYETPATDCYCHFRLANQNATRKVFSKDWVDFKIDQRKPFGHLKTTKNY